MFFSPKFSHVVLEILVALNGSLLVVYLVAPIVLACRFN